MQLTMFQTEDQVFIRIGVERKVASSGRLVRVGVWQTHCPDCGTAFLQAHAFSSFNPQRHSNRRCSACRKPSIPVKRSSASNGNGIPHQKSAPIQMPATYERIGPDHNNPRSAAYVQTDAQGLVVPRNPPAEIPGTPTKPRKGSFKQA